MRGDRGHRGDHSEPLGVTIRWGGLGGLVECYLEVAPALALGAAVSGFLLDEVGGEASTRRSKPKAKAGVTDDIADAVQGEAAAHG